MNIVAIIPARSGSKSVKDKNIRLLNNSPLISYSIVQALQSKYIKRVIVSTDSEYYREIALEYGAEVPFLRPSEISKDNSLDIETFIHAYNWLKENEDYETDIFVHLRPTHPIRDVQDIDKMIELLIENKDATSIRSVSLCNNTPFKMWFKEGNLLEPVVTSGSIVEAYNAPRQQLPKVYMQNACIDVVRADTILKGSMTGNVILGYEMPYDFDIDTEDDFLNAEKHLLLIETLKSEKTLKIVCDIDGVIACKTKDNDYNLAGPNKRNIDIINKLHDEGHRIILFTARGYKTGKNWEETTKKQMALWNVKYDELHFGKPDADIYIDDKFFNLSELINY